MTLPTTARPAVWAHLQPLLLTVAGTCRQPRIREVFLTLCVGLLQTLGRHTLTQVLQGLGRGEMDWSAAYRLFRHARFDLAAGRRAILAQLVTLVPADHPLVVVLDGTQLARSWRAAVRAFPALAGSRRHAPRPGGPASTARSAGSG